METKIIKIKDICPEGYKLDEKRSTLDNLVFIEKKNYNHISKRLFNNKIIYYITSDGYISQANPSSASSHMIDKNNCTSEKQAKKLLAINQLMNVAKYLNEDWKPDWRNEDEKKYIIFIDEQCNRIVIDCKYIVNTSIVYFKTKELAQKAIDILGERTIKLALSTDW